MFWKIISFFQKKLILAIPVFMVLGIAYGLAFNTAGLKQLILPLTFLMVYPMMVNLQLKEVIKGGDTKVQLIAQIINFAVIPFIAYFIGTLFFPEKPLLALGLLLTALLPTSGMTISWTGFAKGNINGAIKMTVIGLILGSLAAPLYIKWLMGTAIEIPLPDIFKQILIIVFLPLLAGQITQKLLLKKFGVEKFRKDIKDKFPMISTLGVFGIVFTAMALKARTIVNQPALLLYLFIPLAVLYLINFLISTIVGKLFLNRGDGIALVYGTVMRNLSISLAIAMTVFGKEGSDIALIIAVAYIIQVQSAAWYVKLTDKIFKPVPAFVAEQEN